MEAFGGLLVENEALNHSLLAAEAQWRSVASYLAGRNGVLLDLGGGSSFQGAITADMLGPATAYLCLDIARTATPDVLGDALYLPLRSASVQSILCNAVLEHVTSPQQVIAEMYRVLAPHGEGMVAVPFIYPYHDEVDYFRFSDTALAMMFGAFSQVRIVPVGDYLLAATMFGIGFSFGAARGIDPLLTALRPLMFGAMDRLDEQRPGRRLLRGFLRSPIGWHVYFRK